MKKQTKIIIGVFTAFISLLIIAMIVFLIYTSDYYHAMPYENTQLEYETDGNMTVIQAKQPSNTGIIFYPGAKVEASAYIPLLEQISTQGVTCVLIEMPFNLAVLGMYSAEHVYENFPEIEKWYIMGHSLGGAMASSYYAKKPERIEGLILLGAYRYKDNPLDKTLTIYGSEDKILNKSAIDYTENVIVIDGGNHAYFGNYGEQEGDGQALIARSEQQNKTVEEVMSFIHQ